MVNCCRPAIRLGLDLVFALVGALIGAGFLLDYFSSRLWRR